MIVKRLRARNNWSQEQLAEFTGLNVRTIQRIEGGQKASLESLKSLASVFEVDISRLTEEITVIDKESEQWKELPWWFRANMIGVNTRRHVVIVELLLLLLGFVFWFIRPDAMTTSIMFLGAYVTGWIVRYGDSKDAW